MTPDDRSGGPAIEFYDANNTLPVEFPCDTRRAMDPWEAFTSRISGLRGVENRKFFPRDGRHVFGLFVVSASIDGSGQPCPLPNQGKIVEQLRVNPLATVSYFEPEQLIQLFGFIEPIRLEDVGFLQAACDALVTAKLSRQDLAPVEFVPGRWRGGLIVSRDRDPLEPRYLPCGTVHEERRTTPVIYSGKVYAAETLLRRAARLAPVPEVEVPVVNAPEGRISGALRSVASLIERGR